MQMPGWLARTMVWSGMLGQITVVGRKSGQPRTAHVGKAAAPGGGWYVGAGDPSRQWALNLRAAGRCRFRVKADAADYVATELSGDQRAAAVRALTPRFSRGRESYRGPVFRLERAG